ncbi:MAG: hypothetical protein DRP65_01450 [Planctomycetota bacterium]|nr:MAG: hypothetical protein DRP65_01450 [Planctomycetota bacterium]
MRRCTVLIVVLLFAMVSLGTALAKEEKLKGKGKAKSPVPVKLETGKTPEEFGRRGWFGGTEAGTRRRRDREGMVRGMMHAGQLKRLDEQIKDRRGRHNSFIGELKAIKKLALQEKASKTAERLQELIDKHTSLFNEEVQKLEERRDRIKELAEKRAKERLKRKERLMERGEKAQEKAEPKGGGKGKGKGQGKGPGKNKAGAQGQD